jgi:hypothetical protein
MDIIAGEEFNRGARAAAAAHRLLACCKGLLGRHEEVLRSYFDRDAFKAFIEDPRILEAYAVIAHVEGRDADLEPHRGWPFEDLARPSSLGFAYGPSMHALEVAGVVTLDDLLVRDPLDLIEAGVSPDAVRGIRGWLDDFGLSLAYREDPIPESHPIFAMPVTRLIAYARGRTTDALTAAGIVTVADLLEWTAEDLLGLHGMGPILLENIEWVLGSYGLELAGRGDPAGVI